MYLKKHHQTLVSCSNIKLTFVVFLAVFDRYPKQTDKSLVKLGPIALISVLKIPTKRMTLLEIVGSTHFGSLN